MSSLYFMIPLGLLLSALAIWLFFWALKGGQYEDLDSPAWGIIMDREQTLEEQEAEVSDSQKNEDTLAKEPKAATQTTQSLDQSHNND
ncbi:MAG: cbb3-type cytochrome oxidase assembly protein CcoS [Xanthomonadales bacterium]|nr:cbb3-type cytochrome oxidase assembly protein CcoS [Xanthomonadales bacterium]